MMHQLTDIFTKGKKRPTKKRKLGKNRALINVAPDGKTCWIFTEHKDDNLCTEVWPARGPEGQKLFLGSLLQYPISTLWPGSTCAYKYLGTETDPKELRLKLQALQPVKKIDEEQGAPYFENYTIDIQYDIAEIHFYSDQNLKAQIKYLARRHQCEMSSPATHAADALESLFGKGEKDYQDLVDEIAGSMLANTVANGVALA